MMERKIRKRGLAERKKEKDDKKNRKWRKAKREGNINNVKIQIFVLLEGKARHVNEERRVK